MQYKGRVLNILITDVLHPEDFLADIHMDLGELIFHIPSNHQGNNLVRIQLTYHSAA